MIHLTEISLPLNSAVEAAMRFDPLVASAIERGTRARHQRVDRAET